MEKDDFLEISDLLEMSYIFLKNAEDDHRDGNTAAVSMECSIAIAAALIAIAKRLEDVNDRLDNIAAVIEAS